MSLAPNRGVVGATIGAALFAALVVALPAVLYFTPVVFAAIAYVLWRDHPRAARVFAVLAVLGFVGWIVTTIAVFSPTSNHPDTTLTKESR